MKQMHKEIASLSAEKREKLGRCLIVKKGKLLEQTLTEYIYRFKSSNAGDSELVSGAIVLFREIGESIENGIKGVVWERTKNSVTVAFQKKLPAFTRARLDLIVDDTVFERMKKGLSKIQKPLMDLLVQQREPTIKHVPLNTNKLNESQKRAVEFSIESELTLIHGPFGTGKTTVIVYLAKELVKRGYRVLITAESNTAVDNIAERLIDSNLKIVRMGHPARLNARILKVSSEEKIKEYPQYTQLRTLKEEIEMLKGKQDRLGVKPLPKFRRGLEDNEILRLAKQKVKSYRGIPGNIIKGMAQWIELQMEISPRIQKFSELYGSLIKRVVKEANIILSTNIGAYSEYLIDEKFDVAIIDEGTQATEPSVILPMTLAKRWVLAGDHKQLPPTVVSNDEQLKTSLFERWVNAYPQTIHMLEIQYRMNKVLMEFPSNEFYGGKLKADNSVINIKLSDLTKRNCPVGGDTPLIAIHVGSKESRREGSKSRINEGEVRVVREVAEKMISCVGANNVGVITPYKDQREILRDLECEVNTVDGYQGREKEVIIISLVRSNPFGNLGFLTDYRRLNVAITRAKRKLIVIGNLNTVSSDPVYRRFIEYINEKGIIIEEY